MLEVQVPDTPGKLSAVKFQMDSPDLVEFDEEERRLYKALGDPIRIETAWVSESEELKAVLVDGEAAPRSVKPREKVQWLWKIEGNLSGEERIALTTHLTSSDGERVDLAPREFVVQPAGLLAPLRASFSLFFLVGWSRPGRCRLRARTESARSVAAQNGAREKGRLRGSERTLS